jgi:hypothetical protein
MTARICLALIVTLCLGLYRPCLAGSGAYPLQELQTEVDLGPWLTERRRKAPGFSPDFCP